MKRLIILGIFVADLSFFGKIPKKGETVLGNEFIVGPGGKGSNQSVAAGKAGANVSFISKIGDDNYGEMARKIYSETNVNTKYLFVSNEKNTGVAAILLDKETGNNAISVVPGAAGALTIDDIKKAEEEIKNSSFFLTQLETPMEITIKALKIANENKVTTILNPAPAAPLDKEIFPLIDYFTPNETEAEFYTGIKIKNEEEAKEASTKLINLGIKKAIITLGEKGLFYSNGKENIYIKALKLNNVVDTTGAGDAFNGALAFALANNKSIKESLEIANHAAGLSTLKSGAGNAMPFFKDLKK